MIKNDRLNEMQLQEDVPIQPFPSLLLLEKMQKLRIQGYSQERVEEMCKPKPMDREWLEQELMERQEKELRRLAKLNPRPKKRRKQGRLKMEEVDGVPVIHISPVDLPEDKRMATQLVQIISAGT